MKILFFFTVVLTPFLLRAQSGEVSQPSAKAGKPYEIKTLAPAEKLARGGYFGLTTHYSRIKGKDAFSVGTRFGYLMNHVFTIGFSGSGFVNDIPFDNILPGRQVYLQGGYGGLLLEPIIAGKHPVHLTFPLMIGGGGVLYNEESFYLDMGEDDAYQDWEVLDSDVFFVVEPGVNLEFNITSYFRIGLETKYRYVNGLLLLNTSANMLNGWSGGLNFKVGKF